jgi:hypothetical protein
LSSREVTGAVNIKAQEIQGVFAGRVQSSRDLNEVAEWATAFVVYAGALLGAVHAKKNRPLRDDETSADEQRRNLLTAMQVGRNEGMRG